MKFNFHDKLLEFGLNEKEATVYIAALKTGSATVQDIALEAKVNRATTYTIIDSLMQMGLMSSYKEGKKQYFYAESPDKIIYRLIRKKQEKLKEFENNLKGIIPNLKALETKRFHKKPVLKFFKGKRGIKNMVKEIFVGQDDTYRVLYPKGKLMNAFDKEFLKKVKQERAKLDNVKTHTICISDEQDPESNARKITLPSSELDISCDIGIYGDHLRIVSLEKPINGIIINDTHIVNTFKVLFDMLFDKMQAKRELSDEELK